MFTYLLLLAVVGIVARMMATSRTGSAASEKELAEMRERLLRLEQSLETMSADMERVTEGQRFLTALLEDRARGSNTLKPPAPPPPAPPAPPLPPSSSDL
jgi:hypothetical protein